MSTRPSTPLTSSAEVLNHDLMVASNIVKRSGARFTPIRKRVYNLLLQATQPLGAYDILGLMDGVGSSKPPTVYRALDWLMDMGLAKKVTSQSKFVALRPDKDNQAIAFLLCQSCGQAEAFDPGPLTENLASIAAQKGFSERETVIEVMGYCKDHRETS